MINELKKKYQTIKKLGNLYYMYEQIKFTLFKKYLFMYYLCPVNLKISLRQQFDLSYYHYPHSTKLLKLLSKPSFRYFF